MKLHFQAQQPARRGGAVIIVVVSLMSTLMFLGLFFYKWTSQELINAEYFADTDPVEIDPDPILDHGLEQLIVGTRSDFPNSALLHSRYSLIANMLGRLNGNLQPANDVHLFNGQGIRVNSTGSTTFDLYYDEDNSVDANQGNMVLNFSAAANGQDAHFFTTNPAADFSPDAGYTYPDLNSMFLCLETFDDSGNRVLIPSFVRPGYHPSLMGTTSGSYSALTTSAQQQRFLGPNRGNVDAKSGGQRYVISTTVAQSGDRTRIIEPFEFDVDVDGDGQNWEMGVWDGSNGDNYDLPVDADGDGIHDAILMDLDHPIMDLPNGRQVVPMFAFKVIDSDALLNLNAHGNRAIHEILERVYNERDVAHVYNDSRLMTRSNLGYSRSEINPGYALANDPSNIGIANSFAFRQHRGFYNDNTLTFDRVQLANTELQFLIAGRAEFDSSLNPIGSSANDLPGRYGEAALVRNAISGTGVFPRAGTTGQDDDADANASIGVFSSLTSLEGRNAGTAYVNSTYTSPVTVYSAIHPLDPRGMGEWLNDTASGATQKRNGTVNLDTASAITTNPVNWPEYKQTDMSDFGVADRLLWQTLGGRTADFTPCSSNPQRSRCRFAV